MKQILLFLTICLSIGCTCKLSQEEMKTVGFPEFPKIINAHIPGAPILGQPTLIQGTKLDIRAEKHGLVYPALYDWNLDGKVDLLLGEFASGQTGSNIKVYLNEGDNQTPKYTGRFFYALDVNNDTITNHQWCCIGIHPRFIDLDNDGYVDILSGQYNPGLISWWRGSKNGFLAREFVEQEGYIEGAKLLGPQSHVSQLDPNSNDYWNYTSASFADFNGDGLIDLFIGGTHEVRVALNIGTKDQPKFGLRKNLLGIDGYPVAVRKYFDDAGKRKKSPRYGNYSGATKMFITPVDWDGDGVLDLLVTHLYGNKEDSKDPIIFFRGVKTDKGLRFQDGISLFTTNQLKKTFPGTQPNIVVADYNNDGINDLVIGLSLPTVNGFEIDSLVAWEFVHDLGIEAPGKDIGETMQTKEGRDNVERLLNLDPRYKGTFIGSLNDDKYFSLWHRGYVYVMLGKKNLINQTPIKGVVANEEVDLINLKLRKQGSPEQQLSEAANQGSEDENDEPVTYTIKGTESVLTSQEAMIEVILNFKKGWHGYTSSPTNKSLGMIPTKVEYNLPNGFELIEDEVLPPSQIHGGYEVYQGVGVKFSQKFKSRGLSSGDYVIGVIINYQVCNEEMCLPPVTKKVDFKVHLKD